jgi:hypothetical protein
MPTQTKTPMDTAKKVVVTTYEELPRRRPGSHVATSSTAARAKTRVQSASTAPTRAAVGGGYSRRAMLLAYAQHLRRRGGWQGSASVPRVLGWGEWKRADLGAGEDGGDHKVSATERNISFLMHLHDSNVHACLDSYSSNNAVASKINVSSTSISRWHPGGGGEAGALGSGYGYGSGS